MMFHQIGKKVVTAILQFEARLVLKKYKPKIVAVTGSVGKTSTKDAIFSVLSTSFFTRKSDKSFNNELGVPLTILGLQTAASDPSGWLNNILDGLTLIVLPHKYPAWLVVEVGADRPGDISAIASWLRPDIAVVTRLSDVPVHVEFFESADQVRHEKSQLVLAASKKSTVILNADDRLVSSMRPLSKGRVITYGASRSADVCGNDFGLLYHSSVPCGISFSTPDGKISIVGALGKQQMFAALAALAVGKALNIPFEKAAAALETHDSPPGRMKILPGIHESVIIDDTYNSSPVAAHEALETLRFISHGRKIAVLGDMMELGAYSRSEHEKLGKKAAVIATDIFTVGTRAKGIAAAALQAGFPEAHIFECSDSIEAGEKLRQFVQAGDIVLLKGSQSVRMERAVAMILAEPQKASELLVRQEPEWKR